MVNACVEETSNTKLEFEDTELRLGMASTAGERNGKRGFDEISVDLKLHLADPPSDLGQRDLHNKPPPKAQVVGWPPVGSFRKNFMTVQKGAGDDSEKGSGGTTAATPFVKVSMDGAPYLRKVDLKIYKTYRELCDALVKMFGSFTMGTMELSNICDYVTTYEDKDGDWMLVGDVPWEMFVESCKRLRIMKGTADYKNDLQS